MLYEDLRQRYGNHVAKRVQSELTRNEFHSVLLDDLPIYLAARAEKAAQKYRVAMENPIDRGSARGEVAQKLWREAEDLAYLLSVAEEISATVRASVASA
jgi:tryptophan synthase alpha subunit